MGGLDRALAAAGPRLPRFAAVVVAVNLILPLVYYLYAGITGANFYMIFWEENHPISWLSVVQLLLVAFAAYANHRVLVRLQSVDASVASPYRWIWWVFTLGFLFLALDEQFELHEMLRDRVMQPGGWFVDFEYMKPGDVGLYLYLAVGLMFTYFMLRELRARPLALWLFVAALVLSAVIVVEDSLNDSARIRWLPSMFWDTAFEEIGEIWGQCLFLLSFVAMLRTRLDRLRRADPAPHWS